MRIIPDVSRYQKIDWNTFKPGVLIVKATEGVGFADVTLNKNIQEARKRNIPIGAYHFARGGDAIKEAEWFLKNASDLDFLVCDWEIQHKDTVGWCQAFCDRVAQAGKPVLLYMNDSTALKYDWSPCKDYPLWIARYKYPGGDVRDDGIPDEKYAPKSNWILWQFTSNGKMEGIGGRVDLNVAKDSFFEFIKGKTTQKRIHLFAHMDRNLVRKGDKVIQYVTPIGTIGTGNGQYFAHLHFSISEGLTPAELKAYKVKEKAFVQKHYIDPRKIDFTKMFGTKMDVGNFGYDWLQWIGYGYHPGVDVNGLKGGNTDFGMPFKSSVNGTVSFEERTWFKNGGWGNLLMIETD